MGVFKLIRHIESLKPVGNNVVASWDAVPYNRRDAELITTD